MKKLTAVIFFAALLLTGCGSHTSESATPTEVSVLSAPEVDLPSLTVEQSEKNCEAAIGSYNWEIDNGDGTTTAVCVDAVHPLDIADSLPLLEADSPEIQLNFSDSPDSIIAWCWLNSEDDAQSVTTEDNTLHLNPGSYVYQVTAIWTGSEGFDNIVHYSFRATVPAAEE